MDTTAFGTVGGKRAKKVLKNARNNVNVLDWLELLLRRGNK